MPNGSQPGLYQQLYQPQFTGTVNTPDLAQAYRWGPGMGIPDFKSVRPQFQAIPWEQYFTPEGTPMHQQYDQTLTDLLARRGRMQEVGGYAGGTLGARISDLQNQKAAQEQAFRQFSTQWNLFPREQQYGTGNIPIWQQTDVSLQNLLQQKNRLMQVGGYAGQLEPQITTLQQQKAQQQAEFQKAQAMYQFGGEEKWKQTIDRWLKAQRAQQYGGDGGGGYDQGDAPSEAGLGSGETSYGGGAEGSQE